MADPNVDEVERAALALDMSRAEATRVLRSEWLAEWLDRETAARVRPAAAAAERLARTYPEGSAPHWDLMGIARRLRTGVQVPPGDPANDTGPLTPDEHAAVAMAGHLWDHIVQRVMLDSSAAPGDSAEVAAAIHTIQNAVLANAAARAYPDLYRPLGGTMHHEEKTDG